MTKSHREGILEVLILIFLSAITLIVVAIVLINGNPDPVADPVWEGNHFVFSTATPTRTVGAENGWWNEIDEKSHSTLPAMPDINLSNATAIPNPTLEK